MNRRSPEAIFRPSVDRAARQIPSPVERLRYLRAVAAAPPPSRREAVVLSIVCSILLGASPPSQRVVRANSPIRRSVVRPVLPPSQTPAAIWLVEKTPEFELYSNGLRIDERYATPNRPRSYRAYPVDVGANAAGEPRTQPAGIVYHTTESLQVEFEPGQNNVLKRVSESLLDYVSRRRSYHFLIDRFGRTYRIVYESDSANHAGHSVWADASSVYVNLNDSFLGVSFEAETGPPQRVTPAQVRSGAMLTEMLRNRYRIDTADCVTHAQVSVNPANFQIGYHTDWASTFPFEKLGLPDNYALPLPSLTLFGFEFDSEFVEHAGPRLAEAARQSLAANRKPLRRRYLQLAAAVKQTLAPVGE